MHCTVAVLDMPTSQRKSKPRGISSNADFSTLQDDPFSADPTQIMFCIRGKPRPQERGRTGWNFSRYNPSKPKQKEFARVVEELCQSRLGRIPIFEVNARLKLTAHFRFPPPKTKKAHIKNTADIDNLCKFVLDALNEVLYKDDGQFVCLVADKDYDDGLGGAGYITLDMNVVG